MTTLSLFLLPTEELLAFEAKRKEAEENTRPPPEPVRARIPFTACLQAFTEPENVPDFWSSALQAKSAGVKSVLAGSTMTTAHSRSFIHLFILNVCGFFGPAEPPVLPPSQSIWSCRSRNSRSVSTGCQKS